MDSTKANDVNNSFKNTVGNGTSLYVQDLTSYFATVDRLYAAGARKFVFNNVVPFDRAQIGVTQGAQLQDKMKVRLGIPTVSRFSNLYKQSTAKYP